MNRGYAAVLLAAVMIAGVGIVALLAFAVVAIPNPPQIPAVAFDREQWKTCDTRTSDARHRMLPSLIRDHRMIGMTPDEVEELLGETAIHDEESHRTCFHYGLGQSNHDWGSWGYPILTVEFKQGRVTRVFQLAGFGAVAVHAPRQQ